ncbi:MAG: signal peptide peptidase SppA [Nocardioides sp.]|nr:signal peptide peptidase SppA [Nocardioides sp.]
MRVPAVPSAVLRRVPGLPGLPGRATPGTVLELDLAHGLVTGPPSSPMEALRQRNAPSVRALRDGLRRAASDDDVLGVLVHVGTCPLSLPEADEVADLLADLATSKPVAAWSETYGELGSGMAGYRVALAAHDVWVQPSGAVGLVGVHAAITLVRGALEKVGLEPQFAQRHEFKSAADQLAAREVTDANRTMIQRIADSVLDDTVARVAAARGLAEDDVRAAVAQSPVSARRAHELGLVDHVGYRDEVYAWAHATWTPEAAPAWRPRYVQRYAADDPARRRDALAGLSGASRRRPSVAVVDVGGPIVLGPGQGRQAGADRVCARLRAVGRQDAVKAVVLRVDSPGGSYVASDAIRREVLRLRESGRPVVASMGSVAASGGYFVAMPADEVVAQPTTLTGSIGVLAGKVVVAGLLDRVGVVQESVDAGDRAGMLSGTRAFTDEEWRVLDDWLDEVYDDFTRKAAHDRAMPWEELEPHARGRVWTGADAHQRGLVDHLGGSRLALRRAAELADLDPDDVHVLGTSPLDLLARLKPAESSESPAAAAAVPLLDTGLVGAGPEALLHRAAAALGVAVPHGVLSLPWGITVR